MTPQPTDATGPRGNASSPRVKALGLILACALGAGAVAVDLGHRFASQAIVDLGPTDSRYAQGFRDIERDGSTWFRWSVVPSSSIALPVRFCGPGTIRMRVRRHFVDPAILSVSIGGTLLGQRTIQAGTDHPYQIIEFPVPKVTCTSYASVLLESHVENDRPLGVAIDWLGVEGSDGFRAPVATVARGGLLVALLGGALWLAGATQRGTLASVIFLSFLVGIGFTATPIVLERILRGGLPATVLTLGMGALLAWLSRLPRLDRRGRTALVTLTLLTLFSRTAFLHSQAFYPDYRVHALVQSTYSRDGLSRFLDNLFEIQYARSLGLQQIDGKWYPFPYPPGSYAVTGTVSWLFDLDPLDASITTAASLASLMPVLTAALGLALGLGGPTSIAGAGFVALQPLLVRRMALGYFPGIAGQFADAVAMLLVLAVLRAGPLVVVRRAAWLSLTLLGGFLIYTQSIANFGLLSVGLMIAEMARRSPAGWRPPLLVAIAATVALGASVWAFYGRYIPVLENVRTHRVQPESRILDRLEQARRGLPVEVAEEDDLSDPYTGSSFDPARGLMRLASRLWRFNGPFVLAIAIGAWLLWRQSEPWTQNLLLAWGSVALWISLLASGLPSPNGFQHLKDLEFVSPLAGLAMGTLSARLWAWHPLAGAVLGFGWAAFAVRAFGAEWLGRLLPLVGR